MILTLGHKIYKPYFEHKKISVLKDVNEELITEILATNRCYFGLHLKSHTFSITTKVQIFKILIRTIIMYGADCLTVSQLDEQNLDVVKR
jgi:hypothetical protein